jgi:hypothetical protein
MQFVFQKKISNPLENQKWHQNDKSDRLKEPFKTENTFVVFANKFELPLLGVGVITSPPCPSALLCRSYTKAMQAGCPHSNFWRGGEGFLVLS